MGYLCVALTLALTVYGQLIVKWRVDEAGRFPGDLGGRLEFLGSLAIDPWIISVFAAAAIAALSWFAAITQLELSRAYPFMGLSFVFVLVLSAVFFSEAITVPKAVGVAMIVAGVAIATRV